MKSFTILLSILTITFLTSCNKRLAFTTDVKQKWNLTPTKLKKVQFYTSKEIILTKAGSESDLSINDGKIVINQNNNSEKVIIKKGTPCVLVDTVSGNRYLFAFEQGERALVFGNETGTGGYYSLMAQNWKNNKGQLNYGGLNYYTTDGDTYLNIKAKVLKKLDSRKRTVKGRKL